MQPIVPVVPMNHAEHERFMTALIAVYRTHLRGYWATRPDIYSSGDLHLWGIAHIFNCFCSAVLQITCKQAMIDYCMNDMRGLQSRVLDTAHVDYDALEAERWSGMIEGYQLLIRFIKEHK